MQKKVNFKVGKKVLIGFLSCISIHVFADSGYLQFNNQTGADLYATNCGNIDIALPSGQNISLTIYGQCSLDIYDSLTAKKVFNIQYNLNFDNTFVDNSATSHTSPITNGTQYVNPSFNNQKITYLIVESAYYGYKLFPQYVQVFQDPDVIASNVILQKN